MTRRALISDTLIVGILLGAVHCRPAPEKTPPDAEVSLRFCLAAELAVEAAILRAAQP